MKKKRILFVPALLYLSTPIFLPILKHLEEYESYLLDCDYINYKYSDDYDGEMQKIKKQGAQIVKIADVDPDVISGSSNSLYRRSLYLIKKRTVNVAIGRAIKAINPELIIMTSDSTYVARYIQYYHYSIPTIILQQGSLANQVNQNNNVSSLIKNLFYVAIFKYPRIVVRQKQKDQIRVYWSQIWREQDNFSCVNEKNIYYLGNPAHDSHIEEGNKRIAKYLSNSTINIQRIIYTTQPISISHGITKKNLFNQIISNFIKSKKHIELIVKMHPRDDQEYYIDIFKELRNVKFIEEAELSDLIKSADLMITGWSMTAYEALALGVPVIAINPNNIFNYKNRYPEDSVPVAVSLNELNGFYSEIGSLDQIYQFIAKRKKFIEWNNTYTDGKSAHRIAKTITNTLTGNIKHYFST